MEKTEIVEQCYHSCKFFEAHNGGGRCDHPYFDDKPSESRMIINHDNSHSGFFPDECPLKIEPLTVTFKLNN